MQRVIEHLELLTSDLIDQVSTLSIQNKTLKEIVLECSDTHEVNLLNRSIDDNTSIIEESKLTLKEIKLVCSILEDANKKRPQACQQRSNF